MKPCVHCVHRERTEPIDEAAIIKHIGYRVEFWCGNGERAEWALTDTDECDHCELVVDLRGMIHRARERALSGDEPMPT